jgi:HSP20 family protein
MNTRQTAIEKRESQLPQAERIRAGRTYVPSVDIVEEQDRMLLIADVPGATPENVDISYERGLLTIHARVKPRQDPKKTNYLLREYGVGDFHRSFEIGEGIDASKIEAEMHDGVLTVHLPKAAELLPRKITVKTG